MGEQHAEREEPPRAPQVVFELGVPVLGICYGMQTMAQQLGGRVAPSTTREFGYAEVTASAGCRLLDHMENEGCSGCHRRTDPIGLALEHFDAIGRWRERDPHPRKVPEVTRPSGAHQRAARGLPRLVSNLQMKRIARQWTHHMASVNAVYAPSQYVTESCSAFAIAAGVVAVFSKWSSEKGGFSPRAAARARARPRSASPAPPRPRGR